MSDRHRTLLAKMFKAAVDAADPLNALKGKLPPPPKGRTVVIGTGKGAAQLAQAFEQLWEHDYEGLVVTRYGYGAPCKKIRVLEAAHPVPDAAGVKAAKELKNAVADLGPDDIVIALICGGGSSLLPAPPKGMRLRDIQSLNKMLLASGEPISVMNDIRRCFSTINGGRLAELAAPAKVYNYVVSDVPGDAPEQVASGPTIPGRPTAAEVRDLIKERGLKLPVACQRYLDTLTDDIPTEPGGEIETQIIASAMQSLKAAGQMANDAGVQAWILSDRVEGEARTAAEMHALLIKRVAEDWFPLNHPMVFLSGGETTVTLRHKGRGGRNSEFQLALALALEGLTSVHALAADTDGIDGSEDNAGAFIDGHTTAKMRAQNIEPQKYLDKNDAYSAFEASGDLFVTGPTGTNVNDFRAILIEDKG